jgi:hypothetical protein
MEINKSKQVQSIVKFDKALNFSQISSLIDEALTEYNRLSMEKWSKKSLLVRWFTSPNLFYSNSLARTYFSHDGKSPMRLAGPYRLNPHEYPDAKYEIRYLLSISGLRNIHLYFNVIPGVAKENQFGTMLLEDEQVSCITIKANLKSNLHWKQEQAKFLELLVPIIEKMNQKMK